MIDNKFDSLKLSNQLCFPLYASAREMIKLYRPYLSLLDLTYTQYITMLIFWEYKKLSVKELGKKLFLDSGTLTPVLKNLESKGYVRRYRSNLDERVLIVEITDEGEALNKKALLIPREEESCVRLNRDEALQLYRLLYKLLGVNEDDIDN